MAHPICGILLGVGLVLAGSDAPRHTFEVGTRAFLLDGKPFQVLSGEMHYPRIPRAYWRDRMQKARAMGLNTVCTYVFWNLHESKPGHWDFAGEKDLAAFIRTAQEEGLFVILRPGPYVCAEWDLGGFPAWLLKDPKLQLRGQDPVYLEALHRYLVRVGQEVKDLQVTRGGPILMAQVENEYGSFGQDHAYMAQVRAWMREAGFEVPLFTSDGPGQDMLQGGTLPDCLPTINFGGGAEKAFAELDRFRSGIPRMNGEFWCGWFDSWGRPHHTTRAADKAKEYAWMLSHGISVNIYMFHGGTNWGFWAGANGSDTEYTPDTTSYDYSAVLDEAGAPTDKFHAFRAAVQALAPDKKLPDLPKPLPRISLAPTALGEWAPLTGLYGKTVRAAAPMTLEALGQQQGFVSYRTRVKGPLRGALALEKVRDYAMVYLDGKRIATLDRRLNQTTVRDLRIPAGTHTLELLVENLGRINFGASLLQERKGLTGKVTLAGRALQGWEMSPVPCEDLSALRFTPARAPEGVPGIYRGTLQVTEVGDTFLDLSTWGKGLVWVNGHNLGRFWNVGPQQTLYLPGCWLKPGANEICVLELNGASKPEVAGRTEHRFETRVDPSAYARKPGQQLALQAKDAVHTGTFAAGEAWQEIRFAQSVQGRYVALEALRAFDGKDQAAITELVWLDASGKPFPREACAILYADSEELIRENGSAWLVMDNQPVTHWCTRQSEGADPYPHALVVDLGRGRTLSGFRYLPRQGSPRGRIQDYRIHVRNAPFEGLSPR